jgi:hypothetical protein
MTTLIAAVYRREGRRLTAHGDGHTLRDVSAFEYLVPWGDNTLKKLNDAGAEGWEAVGVAPAAGIPGSLFLVLLKRPVGAQAAAA